MRTIKHLVTGLVLSVALVVGGCATDRYSTDPLASRIQHLEDFCLTYGAIRDAATNFIKIDTARKNPVLTVDMILAYQDARAFIRPFCSPEFDPNGVFDLADLQEHLVAIRLILLAKENSE